MSKSHKYRPPTVLLAAAFACLTWQGQAAAASDGSELKLSGFGTVGAVAQSVPEGWGFMRNRAQPGSTDEFDLSADSRAGLQIDWRPHPSIELTSQAVLYKRPSGTPASEAIELAYLGWRPAANTRVRLGRTSPDIFLFANSRHLGYALPWVRPPVDMYGFLPIHSLDGIEGSHQWMTADANWLVRGAIGRFGATAVGSFPEMRSFGVKGKDTVALTAQRESGALLIKCSVVQARSTLALPGEADTLASALSQLAALPIPSLADQVSPLLRNLWTAGRVRYFSLGVQYDNGPWIVHAEASRLQVSGQSLMPTTRGYLSLGYRWSDVTLFGVAGRTRADEPPILSPRVEALLGPAIGPAGAARAQGALDATQTVVSAYRHDQSTTSVGLRWDVASNTALKFQLDHVNVRPYGAALWRTDAGPTGARNTVASVALDFVWGQ